MIHGSKKPYSYSRRDSGHSHLDIHITSFRGLAKSLIYNVKRPTFHSLNHLNFLDAESH